MLFVVVLLLLVIIAVVLFGSKSYNSQCVKVDIDTFFERYKSVMDWDMLSAINAKTINGEKYMMIGRAYLHELDVRLKDKDVEKRVIEKVAENNNRGSDCEKRGEIDEAIKIYEGNLSYPACHSFDRLMVLYRKKQMYEDEIRVIKKAIEVLCPRYPDLMSKYEQRLLKATELHSKKDGAI